MLVDNRTLETLEFEKLEEVLNEQLSLEQLEELKGGSGDANKQLDDSKDQAASHGNSNCCNGGW
jgi:hypothetical protein